MYTEFCDAIFKTHLINTIQNLLKIVLHAITKLHLCINDYGSREDNPPGTVF